MKPLFQGFDFLMRFSRALDWAGDGWGGGLGTKRAQERRRFFLAVDEGFQGIGAGCDCEVIIGRGLFACHEILEVEADLVPAHVLVGFRREHPEKAGGFEGRLEDV